MLILLLTVLATPSVDYDAARREHRVVAVRTEARIAVDGHLDEEAWAGAPVAANFTQNEPNEGQPASEPTEVRVLYDNERLYFGFHVHDSEPERIIISDLRKDFVRDSGDYVEVLLDTFHDERNGYLFATNAAGAKWDAQMANEGREVNQSWDGVWYARSRVVADGWMAEIAIPFKTLKFREADVQTWGINFHRSVRRRYEDSYWSPLPRIYNVQRASLAGTIEGLTGIRPGSNIKIKPYLSTSAGQATGRSVRADGDFGVDAKYGVTTGLTLDLTYRTDFSQVEADDQQINLTRFSLLFPEKREFFLENSGIFQFSGGSDRGPSPTVPSSDMLLFFSRRIGLSESGTPIPIVGGARLTGRTGPYELGFLNMRQERQGTNPAANFTVARVRRNLFGSSDVGMMLVNKEALDSSAFNRVVGLDANLRFGRSASVFSYLAKSFTPSGGGKDVAARTALIYGDNTWDIRGTFTNIQERFINEMGYVPRLGMRKYSGFAGRYYRPVAMRRSIRAIFPHVTPGYTFNAGGQLESRAIDYHLMVYSQGGGTFEPGVNTNLERLLSPFFINRNRRIAIPPGVYTFNEYMLKGDTNKSRRVSGNAGVYTGPFYTGSKTTYTAGGTFRFDNRASASFSYTHNNINLPQGHFRTNLLSLRVDRAFSTTMFLNALVQYNDDLRQWSSNIRFDLIHRPLSDLFIVYNDRRDTPPGTIEDRALIVKFTYMIAR